MTGPTHAQQASHSAPVFNALPSHLVSQEVPVRGALSRLPELRSAVRVCEWMVEPVAGSTELALTLVLSEHVSLSFVLGGAGRPGPEPHAGAGGALRAARLRARSGG
jgi:hypothetical protein